MCLALKSNEIRTPLNSELSGQKSSGINVIRRVTREKIFSLDCSTVPSYLKTAQNARRRHLKGILLIRP